MGKGKDLTNQRFYHMVALERTHKPNDKHTFWKCRCDCGNIFISRTDAILNNRVKSCGCGLGKYPDLIGQKYGLLTPIHIDLDTSQKKHRCYYYCQCDCGNYTTVRSSQLLDGSAKSCGCLRSFGEQQIALILRENQIDFQKEISFDDLKGETNYLYFDFGVYYNNNLKYIIEYQGRQHYEPIEYFGGETRFQKQLQYDNKKQQYCKDHNIPLKIISYKEPITSEKVIDWSLLND